MYVCKLQIYIYFQNKVYPKERDHKDMKCRGRIRVHLKNDDGTPCTEKFPDRMCTNTTVDSKINMKFSAVCEIFH